MTAPNVLPICSPSLQAALDYAAAGIAVLPVWSVRADGTCRCKDGAECLKPGKHPLQRAWEHCASTNPSTLRREWPKGDVNLGANLGKSGLICLDIDPRNGGSDSLARLESWLDLCLSGLSTCVVETGRGDGGQHMYFSRGKVADEHLGKLKRLLAEEHPGIDLLYGNRYTLLPPSRHACGGSYRLAKGDFDLDFLSTLPEPLLGLTEAPVEPLERPDETRQPDAAGSWFRNVNEAALANLSTWVPSVLPAAQQHRDGYRVTSADLGRDLEEDLAITSKGIADWGVADQGDPQAGKRTAIDLVLEWLPLNTDDPLTAPSNALEAALWLCEKLRVDPVALGYQPATGDADEPGGPVLVESALGDFMEAELEPVQWAIKPWLPRSCVTLLAGNGGVGKSNLALSLCAHLSTGQPFAGLPAAQLPCLFISLEDSAAIVRWRLRAVVEQFHLDAKLLARNFRLVDGTEAQCAAFLTQGEGYGAQLLWTKAYRELRNLAAGAQFIVIDNASDAMDANENSRSHVRTFIRGLASVAIEQDASVLLLSHLDKTAVRLGAAGSSYSGSTAWNASVRSRLALLDEGGQIILSHEKCNLAATAEPVSLHFEPGGVLVPDSMTRTALDNDLAATPAERDQDAALAAVIAASQAGVPVPDCLTPCAHSAMNALQPFPEYSTHFRGKSGGSRCAAALAALKRAGRLKSEEYRKPNRHASTRLVASESAQSEGAA